MKISVIIPVYNSENTLERCVGSILAQTFTDFEVILVDDGSTDESGTICDIFKKNDSRVKVVRQQNLGVSAARNRGLDMASGEWIAFVDADDWVKPDYLERLLPLDPECDMSICAYADGADNTPALSIPAGEYGMDMVLIGDNLRLGFAYLWGKLMRRDIIEKNGIRNATSVTWGEDYLFMLEYYCHVRKVMGVAEPLYHYNPLESGLSSHRNKMENCVAYLNAYMPRIKRLAEAQSFDPKPYYRERYTWLLTDYLRYIADRISLRRRIAMLRDMHARLENTDIIAETLRDNRNAGRLTGKLYARGMMRALALFLPLRLRIRDARASAARRKEKGILSFYRNVAVPLMQWRIRRKKRIEVMFVLSDLGMWKTEGIYLDMLAHPRFNPRLVVVDSREHPGDSVKVMEYLDRKGYKYTYLDAATPLQQGGKADIIFYQKPYAFDLHDLHGYRRNLSSLFCYAAYGIHNIISEEICNQPFHNLAWQYYFENDSCAVETAEAMDNKGKNICVTGVPAFDNYHFHKEINRQAWRLQGKKKKRIIYAPHFSLRGASWLNYATFLENGEMMLEMARKYAEEVQFAFKPHPLLYKTLVKEWGEDRAREYYHAWEEMPNAQLETGKYSELFIGSDAMIHDCSSFTNEYMLTGHPVMYLVMDVDDHHADNLNTFARKAYELHYKGHNHKEIEEFIQDVIAGRDPMQSERQAYYDEYLQPVKDRPASENILDAILGIGGGNAFSIKGLKNKV